MGANFETWITMGIRIFIWVRGIRIEALMPNLMYRNQAGQGFADVTTAGGFGHLQRARSGLR